MVSILFKLQWPVSVRSNLHWDSGTTWFKGKSKLYPLKSIDSMSMFYSVFPPQSNPVVCRRPRRFIYVVPDAGWLTLIVLILCCSVLVTQQMAIPVDTITFSVNTHSISSLSHPLSFSSCNFWSAYDVSSFDPGSLSSFHRASLIIEFAQKIIKSNFPTVTLNDQSGVLIWVSRLPSYNHMFSL